MVVIKKRIFNVPTGSKNVTRKVAERINSRFDLASFYRALEEGSVEVPLIKPMHLSALGPEAGNLTNKGSVPIT